MTTHQAVPLDTDHSPSAGRLGDKRPEGKHRLSTDWSEELELAGGLQIAGSTWNASPNNALDDLTLSQDTHDTTETSVLVEGGTSGEVYTLINTVTLSDGQQWDAAAIFRCLEYRIIRAVT